MNRKIQILVSQKIANGVFMIYLAIFAAYILIGAGILLTLDRNSEVLEYFMQVKQDPIRIVVFLLWPLVIMFYLLGRKRNDNAR